MSTHSETTILHKVFEPLAAAPRVLLAYIIFAVLVTFTDFVVLRLVSESFRAQLVLYTGWLASMFYAFTIFFAASFVRDDEPGIVDRDERPACALTNWRRMRLHAIRVRGAECKQVGHHDSAVSPLTREVFAAPYRWIVFELVSRRWIQTDELAELQLVVPYDFERVTIRAAL
jgi:hypothetical protein